MWRCPGAEVPCVGLAWLRVASYPGFLGAEKRAWWLLRCACAWCLYKFSWVGRKFYTLWWFVMSHFISDVAHNARVHSHAVREESFQANTIYYTAMAAKVLLCRLYWESVLDNRVLVFLQRSHWKESLHLWISLSTAVSSHILCSKCLTQVVTLEKESVNIAVLERSARSFSE